MDSKNARLDHGGEAPPARRPSKAEEADCMLEGLGYTPELTRSRSTLQVAFMSFVLASIPWGLSTTLYYPLVNGGPVTIIWGWILVSLIILCVAASLGEITSVYPTAGGTVTLLLACTLCTAARVGVLIVRTNSVWPFPAMLLSLWMNTC
jgi:hypothetical protein